MSQIEVFINEGTLGALSDPTIVGFLLLAMFVGLAVTGGYKAETKLLFIAVGLIFFLSMNSTWAWIALLFLIAVPLFLLIIRLFK
jgi:hypothetical protein